MRWVLTLIFAIIGWQAQAWPDAQTRIGQENHPKVLAQYGGEVPNLALAGYIDGIGRVITRSTSHAHERWTFTVLDTPVVNAFAVPGGYIYVTRGLLALANSEAEVAAVIGHEVAHLTRNHVSTRQKQQQDASIGILAGTVLGAILDGKEGLQKGIELSSRLASGYVAQHSQRDEFEADDTGIAYLAAAGYDALAQSRFLANLAAKQTVEAERAGRGYNPNRIDFFASHPATGDRVRRAIRVAGGRGGVIGDDDYKSMIDGIIYGDSARQGFVRGRRFLHPELRFALEVPPGFRIVNSSSSIVANGPKDARFVVQSGGQSNASPKDFLTSKWLPSLQKLHNIKSRSRTVNVNLNGLPGARFYAAIDRRGRRYMGEFTVVAHNGRMHLFTGMIPGGSERDLAALRAAAESYRPLSQAEAAALRPLRIRMHRVREGDTIDGLAAQMPGDLKRKTFVALNGLGDRQWLTPGEQVKLIVE